MPARSKLCCAASTDSGLVLTCIDWLSLGLKYLQNRCDVLDAYIFRGRSLQAQDRDDLLAVTCS